MELKARTIKTDEASWSQGGGSADTGVKVDGGAAGVGGRGPHSHQVGLNRLLEEVHGLSQPAGRRRGRLENHWLERYGNAKWLTDCPCLKLGGRGLGLGERGGYALRGWTLGEGLAGKEVGACWVVNCRDACFGRKVVDLSCPYFVTRETLPTGGGTGERRANAIILSDGVCLYPPLKCPNFRGRGVERREGRGSNLLEIPHASHVPRPPPVLRIQNRRG